MVTPFDDAGTVRYDYFDRNIDRYLEAGVNGFLVAGSTGESVYLEHEEKLKLVESARKRIPLSKMLLAGTGLESTRATVELTREVADRGVDAVLVKNPSFYRSQMTAEAYLAHYTTVADRSPVPLIIYNVPVFTGIPLESRLVVELARHPNIVGMKDSSGDVKLISEVVWNADPKKFAVVAGTGATLFHTMAAGARGGIVALVCAAPAPMLALYRSFVSGNLDKAGAVQRVIAPAANAVTSKYGIAGLKYAMELEGFHPGSVRRPLLPIKTDSREDLQQIFRKMNSELFELS